MAEESKQKIVAEDYLDDSEYGEPIGQSITTERAQGIQLVQAWAERSFPERTVAAMRNVSETVTAGCTRHIGERKAAACENPANAVRKR